MPADAVRPRRRLPVTRADTCTAPRLGVGLHDDIWILGHRTDCSDRDCRHPGSIGAARDVRCPWLDRQEGGAGPPPPRAQPTVWPRLDPGAVLCRTEDDLDRHAANMTARVSGGDGRAADCRSSERPDQILSRQGLGRTAGKSSVRPATLPAGPTPGCQTRRWRRRRTYYRWGGRGWRLGRDRHATGRR